MKRLTTLVLTALLLVAIITTTAFAAGINFTDVKTSDWFYNDVKSAVQMGLVNGKTATTYGPDDYMTYAEAVKLAACMHEKYTTGNITLAVSPTGKWYDSYVDYAKSNGIITTDFNWDIAATRAGYMSIFAHALPDSALQAINNVPDDTIPDVKINTYYGKDIYKLYRAGIVRGVDAKYNCNPGSNIKRSEVAAILTRMMDSSARQTFSTVAAAELTIVTQPKSVTIAEGADAKFSVVASGGTEPYTYEWHRVIKADGNYDLTIAQDESLITGTKTANLTTKQCLADENGDKYYCIVTDADGNKVNSEKATLTVTAAGAALSITKQPANTSATVDGSAKFSVTASGGTAPYSYEWRRIASGSATYYTVPDNSVFPGAKTANLTVNYIALSENGDKYYCVVTDSAGQSVESNKATLTVNAATATLSISTQPKSTTVTEPADAYFSVTATGGTAPYSYQWYKVPASGGSAFAISNTTLYSGFNTANLTAKTNLVGYDNGAKFYCVVTDSNNNSVTSNQATLTVNAATATLSISTQPKSTTVTEPADAYFSVTATGGSGSYTYQWYRISPGNSTGYALSTSSTYYSGVTTANLTAKKNYVDGDNGAKFYCVVKDSNGQSVTSNSATLTVKAAAPLTITKQPSNTSVRVGKDAYFSITVSGGTPPYSCSWWKVQPGSSGDGFELYDTTWYSGFKTTNLIAKKVYKNNTDNGAKFYCVVKDSTGKTVTSNRATLTVLDMDVTIPSSKTAKTNTTIEIPATVQGGITPLSYQWFYGKSGNMKESSITSSTYRIQFEDAGSYQVFCYVTDNMGNEAGSNVCYITVTK